MIPRRTDEVAKLRMELLFALIIAPLHHKLLRPLAGITNALTMTVLRFLMAGLLFAWTRNWVDAVPFLVGSWFMSAYVSDAFGWFAVKILKVPGALSIRTRRLISSGRVLSRAGVGRFHPEAAKLLRELPPRARHCRR